ncbi:MAG: glutamine-hydrolyzing carbamoyl-phosphate synthase small subunit [Clostridia bacterium]|nr:glutamine-hydrolyzing carbamoyl-phosphate synthase small subunit [Clostridia bacterium]
MKKAYLILENKTVLEGTRIGAEGESYGELVFTTGVVGYLETLTDSAFAGQIILQSFPQIGNYGVIEEDLEGPCLAAGYVVQDLCTSPSNFRAEYDLNTYLKKAGVPGIMGIDTRALVRLLGREGAMRACIMDAVPADLDSVFSKPLPATLAGCAEKRVIPAKGIKKYNVSVLDFGISKNMLSALTERGCEVMLWPKNSTASDIQAAKPDGLLISAGPGDPEDYPEQTAEIKKLIGTVPTLGIGLGHQLCALAMGGKTEKLFCGHRGANHPVKSADGRVYIVQQNHGYTVKKESLPGAGELFINLHDGTNEGLIYPEKGCFTVQFYPVGHTDFIWDAFIKEMGGNGNA